MQKGSLAATLTDRANPVQVRTDENISKLGSSLQTHVEAQLKTGRQLESGPLMAQFFGSEEMTIKTMPALSSQERRAGAHGEVRQQAGALCQDCLEEPQTLCQQSLQSVPGEGGI